MKNQKAGKAFEGATPQKYDNWQNEYRQFAEYLKKNTATATMVAIALNIYRPNACRYKRWLQEAGKLWETGKAVCAITGFKAAYLTTNPDLRPSDPQTRLFDGMEGIG
ncbi:hypothetical protein ABDK00_013185 [Niabella insulamsoli]|uniref:hypothetical protein n=1 Tax=Niabella insulamsoli TaxID=3144874 RepID=UPI0031FC5964